MTESDGFATEPASHLHRGRSRYVLIMTNSIASTGPKVSQTSLTDDS